jgi:tricorn protease
MSQHGYYRQATISHERIVFVCEDDLWTVTVDGGVARRLTASPGEISTPRLSPDGKTIAFVGRDDGHPEIYVMPADGGIPRRLTYVGASGISISQWTPNGTHILFTSDAVSPFSGIRNAFSVAREGGTPAPLDLGDLCSISVCADGRTAIGRNADDPARWKRYRGGTAGDLWVDADGNGTFRRLLSLQGNHCWPMWIGERIAFLSDHEGFGNIYSVFPDGSDLRRHTHESEYYARFPSTDGSRIVYTAGAQIRILTTETGTLRTLDVTAPSSAPQLARRFADLDENLEHIAPNPDGTSLALVSRGSIFTMPFWEEAVTTHGLGSDVRYRLSEWLSDGKRFVCVSDEGGREHLELRDANAEQPPKIISHDEIGRITELAASPTADIVACANHRHELILIDLTDHRTRVVDSDNASLIHDLAFSPDGRWLAYACSVAPEGVAVADKETSVIRVVKVKSGAVHTITPLLRNDRSPAWDPQGCYLYFLSSRDFNPVYDALQFDLNFPQAMRPFCITLRPDVPSPFTPKPMPIHHDPKDHDEESEHDKDQQKKLRIEIDFDGIQGRLLAFPVEEGEYGQLVAAKGRVLFTRFPQKAIKPTARSWDEEHTPGTLLAYDFAQQRCVALHHEVEEIRLAADGRTLLYHTAHQLRAIDALAELPEDEADDHKADHDPGRRSGWIDLTRANVKIVPLDEWTQMFHEAWRLQREQFWNADMSGVDWELIRERYAKLIPVLRTRSELSDLIWEMQGELGTSHAYEIGGDHRHPPNYFRGFLGADLAWDAQAQAYRATRIYRGDSWNRELDSPLATPGVDVRQGDLLLALNGTRLSETLPPDVLLVNYPDREIALTVASDKSQPRRIVVRTLRSERMLRYRSWVDANRSYVHQRSGGSVGYLHIPDMGAWGFAEFHRGYLAEFNRGGLIVDVRFNRGGHISSLLLEKLIRRRIGYDVPRYGPPFPYPPESISGPIVALTNQFAGSDGDIFSHAFKLYDLGVLVGKRTWGGVIGIDPYHELVDGTTTTQPEYSFWFTDVGWKIENFGAEPDYDVDIAPHDAKAGRDPQMERALELISELSVNAPPTPQFDRRPRLTIPTGLPG